MRIVDHLISILVVFGALMLASSSSAQGQFVNLSDINIGDRSDSNVLDAQSYSIAVEKEGVLAPETIPPGQKKVLSAPPEGYPGRQYLSRFSWGEMTATRVQFFSRYDFVSNNSFLGKGVLNTNQADIGCDILTPQGTEIIPYFSYSHGLNQTQVSKYSSNLLGGTLSLSQKLYPFVDKQPNAARNFEPASVSDLKARNDTFPCFDFKGGVDLTFGNSDAYTYRAGKGVAGSQDSYILTPNVTFDLFVSNHFAVSIIPTYAYSFTSNDQGGSGSNGLLQFQDRNSYTVFSKFGKGESAHSVISTLQLYELNILERSTNQEPLPPAGQITYQTWAKFGFGAIYQLSPQWTVKAQYAYEAFNTAYEAHYVNASVSVSF